MNRSALIDKLSIKFPELNLKDAELSVRTFLHQIYFPKEMWALVDIASGVLLLVTAKSINIK
jgi:hypothetical protein